MGVLLGRGDLGMAKQHLDNPDISVGLQEVGREAVAQRMQRGGPGDARKLLGGQEGTAQLPRRDRVDLRLALEEPAPGDGPRASRPGEARGGRERA
jgi:hypothetical protein